ncbi:cytosolic enolase 3 [Quercus suber]|uniref:phosphopyruvate hydratase n=1 Tax=Quercus suber TaxID=58331 RepID=A0AAW0LH19_QUESU
MSVQQYLEKHMLSRKIEDAVNAAVRAKTPDPVIFISHHMRKSVPSVITKIKARQILDSRGIPTVEVDLFTNKGMFRASVPSGDTTGMYEAVDLRDGDKGTFLGNSVTRAVKNINEKISEALIGMDPTLQSQIDQAMIDLDKTEKKSELGANAILAVSIAACKAGAAEKEVPLYKHIAGISGETNLTLPVPAFTLISGGKHAGNHLAIQEIMILPIGASRFEEALQMGSETYHHLKAVITEKYGAHECNVGEDGGFAPNVSRQVPPLERRPGPFKRGYQQNRAVITEKYGAHECNVGEDGGFAPNVSRQVPPKHAVSLYDMLLSVDSLKEGLDLLKEAISRTGYNDRIKIAIDVAASDFCIEYPVVSIEDPFDKEDWEHVKHFFSLGICQVVGDDLLMSNPKRIQRAIQESTCNALLLKLLRIEEELGDQAVYAGQDWKLLRIEEELGDQAVYAGQDWKVSS